MDLDSRPHSEMLKKVSTLKCCKMQFAHPKDVGVLRHVHLFVYFVCFRCAVQCAARSSTFIKKKKERKTCSWNIWESMRASAFRGRIPTYVWSGRYWYGKCMGRYWDGKCKKMKLEKLVWAPTHPPIKQARKPRSYASPKLCSLNDWLTYLLTGVKCRATSVAKKCNVNKN